MPGTGSFYIREGERTVAFTNSKLVSYTKISPNRTSPRNRLIDTITIHCTAGRCSVESLGDIFARSSRQASSNYGIGEDGRIGMYCEEKDRSWCSSSASNDNRAITIECSSDKSAPFAINDKVYNSLVVLCADICLRNGIPELRWKADKGLIGQIDQQNMTVHKWFANKDCPGEYIYSRLGQIAEDTNRILRNGQPKTNEEEDMVRWKTLDDVPKGYYRDETARLIKEGVLKGKSGGTLDITEDMLRTILITERIAKKK